MNPRATRTAPPIHTLTTRQLASAIHIHARRHPDTAAVVASIRQGDNAVLLGLVRRARAGDADAGLVAVWALLPRLSAVIRNRVPIVAWRRAADDYIGLAYLTICDVGESETADHLADKLISRIRRRYERGVHADNMAVLAIDHRPVHETHEDRTTAPDSVENQATASAQFAVLLKGSQSIPWIRRDLACVVNLIDSDRPASGPERTAAMRSRRRLRNWLDNAA